MIELRSRPPREWPRYRQGARRDEADWISSLNDQELGRLARGLASVDKAVAKFHEIVGLDASSPSVFQPPREDGGHGTVPTRPGETPE